VKFKIDIDGSERQVEASAEGTLVLDGEKFMAKVAGSTGDKLTVQVGDKTYEVRIAQRSEDEAGIPIGYVLEVAGERVPVAVKEVSIGSPQVAAASAAAAAGPEPAAAEAGGKAPTDYKDGVFAPVPGKIVDVRVKPGDTVNEGDLVLILEAMKMENELHAPKQATIAAVLVSKGDQATKGQLLVAFE
jgi:biotin carboxyl carrier protein